MSKFGSLALVSADNPGAFLSTQEAQEEGELDVADLKKAEGALTGLGYVVVPKSYSGCGTTCQAHCIGMEAGRPPGGIASWAPSRRITTLLTRGRVALVERGRPGDRVTRRAGHVLVHLLAHGMPMEKAAYCVEELGPGFDASAEPSRRPETDMAVWRMADHLRREELKAQFRRNHGRRAEG